MENRIDELASIVEWVDDMALEPKWRLGALHAIRADGRREVVGVRNLDTIRDRLRHCMVRRVRQDVLDQLPPRTDTRVPIEMTEAQMAAHDELDQPIVLLVQRSLRRPLTQAEFLRLMSLLTTQRIICNGLAQLDFEEHLADDRESPARGGRASGPVRAQADRAAPARPAARPGAGAQESWSSASGGGCSLWPTGR